MTTAAREHSDRLKEIYGEKINYETLRNLPSINNTTIKGAADSLAFYGASELEESDIDELCD